MDVFRQAIAQNDQWVLWNTKQTKLLLYMRTYVNWRPPTRIFKLILEPFWRAQIDGRDPLITNIIVSKQVWGQVRSREVIKHLKNMKKTDFFNIQINHISSHKRPIRTLDSSNWRAWSTDYKYHIFVGGLRSNKVTRGHQTFEKSAKKPIFSISK